MYSKKRSACKRWLVLAAVGGVFLTVSAPVVHAHEEPNKNSRWLVRHADLIFRGVVTNVQYRVSDVVKPNEDVPIPHTYVSFKIEQVYKGRSATPGSITVRFEGGLDASTDEVLAISGMPRFDAGENVILFVQGNTKRICPVAGWDKGRFRVIDGLVYNEFGQEVWLTPANEFGLGPSHPLPEVIQHSIGSMQFFLEGSPVGAVGKWMPRADWRRADVASFAWAVSQLVKEVHTAAELANLAPARSASPFEKLVVKEAKPAPPPRLGPNP
jgi:hypothetical protein